MSEEPFWRHVPPIELAGREYRAVTDKATLNETEGHGEESES